MVATVLDPAAALCCCRDCRVAIGLFHLVLFFFVYFFLVYFIRQLFFVSPCLLMSIGGKKENDERSSIGYILRSASFSIHAGVYIDEWMNLYLKIYEGDAGNRPNLLHARRLATTFQRGWKIFPPSRGSPPDMEAYPPPAGIKIYS